MGLTFGSLGVVRFGWVGVVCCLGVRNLRVRRVVEVLCEVIVSM